MQELEKILEEIKQEQEKRMDELKVEIRPLEILRNREQYKGLCVAEKIIRRHMNDGWIPAKKKPAEDGFYVATMSGILVDQKEPFVGLAEFEDGEWVDGNDVIVWRPLPEPYRPEKE